MKISEMNTVQMTKFMSKALPPIQTIMNDGNVIDKLKNQEVKVTEGMSEEEVAKINMEKGFNMMFDFAIMLSGKFPNEVNKIVAASEEKTIKEVENQSGLDTIKTLVELLQDKALINFIFSLLK